MMNASAGIPRLTTQRGYMGDQAGTITGSMSAKEVATFQGVPPKMVYRWLRLKRPLPVRREGRRIFISVEDLDGFLTARKPTSQSPEPETGPEDGKPASVPERAASAPRPPQGQREQLQHQGPLNRSAAIRRQSQARAAASGNWANA